MNSSAEQHYGFAALRRALGYFLVGRPITAILRLAIVFLIVNLLSPVEYGAFVALDAMVQIAWAVSMFGIDWVAIRYLPELRIGRPTPILMRFAMGLFVVRLILLAAFALPLYLLAEAVASLMGLAAWTAALKLYVVYLVIEGCGEFLRNTMLAPLLLQASVQLNVVLRNAAIALALSAVMLSSAHATLAEVVLIQIGAATLALLLGLVQFARYSGRPDSVPPAAQAPRRLGELIRFGLYNYLGSLLTQVSSLHTMMVLATRILGPEVAAPFGFAKVLTEQTYRYLPSTYLSSLLRPKLFAEYSAGGDFDALRRGLFFLYKGSLFALLPVIVAFVLGGTVIVDFLSGNRFGDHAMLVPALMLTLLPLVHRHILGSLANAIHRSGIVAAGSAAAALTLPLAVALMSTPLEIIGVIVAVFIGECLHNATAIWMLHRSGFPYAPHWPALARLAAGAVLAVAMGLPFVLWSHSAPWTLAAIAAGMVGYLVATWWLKPFAGWERDAINRQIGRPLFVW